MQNCMRKMIYEWCDEFGIELGYLNLHRLDDVRLTYIYSTAEHAHNAVKSLMSLMDRLEAAESYQKAEEEDDE